MSRMTILHLFIRTETVRASGAARAAAIAIDDALNDMGAHVPADDSLAKAVQQLHRALAHLQHAEGVRAALSQDHDPFDSGLKAVA